jgi:2-oxoglutarate dehydrogenase E2 component (dihydrolipoamide succinyltransferase)
MIEIKVPAFGESIQEVQIAAWLKQDGEWVDKDEEFVELESEKATQALPSPEAGVLRITAPVGAFAKVGDVIAKLEAGAKPSNGGQDAAGATAAAAGGSDQSATATIVMPAAERMLHEYKISADAIQPSGPGGRLQKEDVIRYVEANDLRPGGSKPAAPAAAAPATAAPAAAKTGSPAASGAREFNESLATLGTAGARDEQVKPMSMLRRTIASRLVEAQQTAALLTTFNEIDMMPVMELRTRYKDSFAEKHGVKLGFMSFFAKATVEGLKRFPAINSEIRGTDVVSRSYYDIGIAIGGGKGLIVPVLRNVERMSFAEVERSIGHYAGLAKDNKLKPADLEGGTFTISNGGVYGSLLSTPIVNPPQSGILGLHAIQERPIAVEGQVVIRPMMYIALTYDHRIVDGREAVGFLRTIKDVLEEPARLFLEV